MTENLSEFMPIYNQIKRLAMEIAYKCHDQNPDVMLTNIKELFNKLETEALQLTLFDNPAPEH